MITDAVINQVYIQYNNAYNVLYPSTFEKITSENFNLLDTQTKTITLDFSEIIFFEVATLINLSAYLNQIVTKRKKIQIRIKLPKNDQVVRFLCTWNLREALEYSTNRNFYDFLSKEDGERYMDLDYRVNETARIEKTKVADNLDTLTKRKFFSIFSFTIPKDYHSDKQLILDFSQRKSSEWQRWEIRNILDRYILDINNNLSDGHIGSNIFFECISNSLRHPKGSILQVASKFTKKKRVVDFVKSQRHLFNTSEIGKELKIENNFTLIFWDNGDEIIQTLKGAKRKYKHIRVPTFIHRFPQLKLYYVDETNSLNRVITDVDSAIDPTQNSEDFYWLISAFFPGITSDPHGENYVQNTVKEDRHKKSMDLNTKENFFGPGMGLYNLLDTTINCFAGEIVVRSGFYRMIIKKDRRKEKTVDYLVSIKRKKNILRFNGNLITVRLPVRDKDF